MNGNESSSYVFIQVGTWRFWLQMASRRVHTMMLSLLVSATTPAEGSKDTAAVLSIDGHQHVEGGSTKEYWPGPGRNSNPKRRVFNLPGRSRGQRLWTEDIIMFIITIPDPKHYLPVTLTLTLRQNPKFWIDRGRWEPSGCLKGSGEGERRTA